MSSEGLNGYVLSGVVLPEEIIIHVASFFDPKTLLNCRLVCRVWQELVDSRVWRYKFQRACRKYYSNQTVGLLIKDQPWSFYYSIFCSKYPYGRNLIKNPCGEAGFEHWKIIENGGNRFIVESPPVGCDGVPDVVGSKSCFVTSYRRCSKEQWINLAEEGIQPHVMDELRPAIHVCDWYANRVDCGGVYEMKVSLCDANKTKLKKHICLKRMMDAENTSWTKEEFVFRRYPAGVRFIRFCHKGRDTKFWAGHYGAKMTGSSVKLLFLQGINSSESEFSDDVDLPYEDSSDEYSGGDDIL